MIDYTIIVPVYFNEGTLDDLINQIDSKVFKKNKNLTGQVVFCEDGSNDRSYEKLKIIKELWPNVKIIKLTRNFGQIPAIYASLSKIKSKAYIIMSADLQDPVELINDFLFFHFKEGFNIVGGERESRKDSFISTIGSKLFYKLLSKLSFPNYPLGGFDFVLISNKVRNLILEMNQSDPFIQGEILFTGFDSKFIPYNREKRISGKSQWSLSKKIKYFIDAIMGYSLFPLRIMSFFGIILFLCSISFLIYIIISKIYGLGNMPYGWASLMVIILFLGGIQMIFLGILGEYLWRVLSQVRNKPHYVIEKIIE